MSSEALELETYLTVAEVAERLKVNDETVRRLFLKEEGVVVICFPRRGRRVYRTVRIPESVFRRVVVRLTRTSGRV
jgi:excisionase family DNA binding protein